MLASKDNEIKLPYELLVKILDYNKDTGDFIWKIDRTGGTKAGDVAGFYRKADGYHQIKFDGTSYLSHRLAWLYVYGSWPKEYLDHINQNKRDNRIVNLREATSVENHRNVPMQKNNKSGVVGFIGSTHLVAGKPL